MKMLAGDIACHRILENKKFAAVLEPKPLRPGHTLVFPKREVDALFELDEETLSGLILFAKRAAQAIKEEISCRKVALVAYGLQTPHAHLHLIPVDGAAGEIDLSRPRPEAAEKDLAALAAHIIENPMLNGETIRLDGAIRMAPR